MYYMSHMRIRSKYERKVDSDVGEIVMLTTSCPLSPVDAIKHPSTVYGSLRPCVGLRRFPNLLDVQTHFIDI